MSEEVKRYCMRAFGSIVQPIEVPYSGTWVPSADHDRIVAELKARVDRLSEDSIKDNASFGRAFKGIEAERDQFMRIYNAASAELCQIGEALGIPEGDQCTPEILEKINALNVERDTLRAEVELLKEHEPRLVDVERLVKALSFLGVSTPESMEESCIRWLSLVRTLIRTAEDSKMLRQDSERLAEVEGLRKDAALFRRLRDLPDELLGAPGVPCVAIPEGQRAGRYVSGPDLDAAMEASR